VTDVAPYDHYRPPDASEVPDGVYRVVGRSGDEVTLLAVADADGRRVHAGRLLRVPAARVAAEFDPAPNPDAGLDLGGLVDWVRWFPRALRDRLP
jgi:hypothetical protein